MNKRLWLRWIIVIVIILAGVVFWAKNTIDEQPTEHTDPGVPEVPDLPNPEDVE